MKETFYVQQVPYYASGLFNLPIVQPLSSAVDVSKYDSIDLRLVVPIVTSPPANVSIFTGATLDPNDTFLLLAIFPTVLTSGSSARIVNIRDHQRYIYWSLSTIIEQTTTIAFTIAGVGRYSCECC